MLLTGSDYERMHFLITIQMPFDLLFYYVAEQRSGCFFDGWIRILKIPLPKYESGIFFFYPTAVIFLK
jgi:hypothetical protein